MILLHSLVIFTAQLLAKQQLESYWNPITSIGILLKPFWIPIEIEIPIEPLLGTYWNLIGTLLNP